MYKRSTLRDYFPLILLTVLFNSTAIAQQRKFTFSQPKMGSPLNIVIVTDDSLKAAALASHCFNIADSLNTVFSDYDPSSELETLNTSAGSGLRQKVSPQLWDILMRSAYAWQKSDHTFDITIGPLSAVWRKARKEKQFPQASVVVKAKQLTGFNKLRTDSFTRTVSIPVKGMWIDLGGIAKGYLAQEIISYLLSRGITSALADAGGDMAMSGAPPGASGWTIGITVPETTEELIAKRLSLHNTAVATSGDVYQHIDHKGKTYSHIIDPRTGYGIQIRRNVTVIARDGSTADWLATACSILPLQKALTLAASEHAELLIMEITGKNVTEHATKGFARYWKKPL